MTADSGGDVVRHQFQGLAFAAQVIAEHLARVVTRSQDIQWPMRLGVGRGDR